MFRKNSLKYCEDNLIIVQSKEIVLTLDIHTLNFENFIKLQIKPIIVLFFKVYLNVTYENGLMQIQSLECETDNFPSTNCSTVFTQYFNYDVKTKQGEQYNCDCFFKFIEEDLLRMKHNYFNN